MVKPENQKKGYVIVFRSMIDHETIGFKKPFSKAEAWIWLIANANYEDRKEYRDFGGKERLIETPRGSLSHSYRFLSQKWGWSKNKVIKFLELGQQEKMLTLKRVQQITQISICKYDSYQNGRDSKGYGKGTADSKKGYKDNTLNTFIIKYKTLNNKETIHAIEKWIIYRKEIKKPYKTEIGFNRMLDFLSKQPDPIAVIDQSLQNEWQGLFELKTNGKPNRSLRVSADALVE